MQTIAALLVSVLAAAALTDCGNSSAPDSGGGDPCGGTCLATEYCRSTDDQGSEVCSGAGTCVSRLSCPEKSYPVCGCDGKVYSSICAAYGAGVGMNNNAGSCTAPSGSFPCGMTFCDVATQYCEESMMDGFSANGFACLALPPTCGNLASCACLQGVTCGTAGNTTHPYDCGGAGDDGLFVICGIQGV